MKVTALVIMAITALGCQSTSYRETVTSSDMSLYEQAHEAFQGENYFEARKLTEKILRSNPEDPEAENLMAEILDAEIARQKEVLEPTVVEELSTDEKLREIKTWTERAEGLLASRQYEQAILAAEKVFLYDPDNLKASQLTDEIKKEALKEGEGDRVFLKQIAQDEIRSRIDVYREQAKTWMAEGRLGAARLAVEKILLLAPNDSEAQRLYSQILEQKKLKTPHETREAL